MKHLTSIDDLTAQQVEKLLQRAMAFKAGAAKPQYATLVGHLFYENSTRTKISFEIAAHHLGMKVIHFDAPHSSENKGEIITDTVHNLAAMGVQQIVVRHTENGLPEKLRLACGEQVAVINAGDGQNEHPTQALLDLMTIASQKPDLSALKIAIVGNIKHSRVAHSFQKLSRLMGVKELFLVAPPIWQPDTKWSSDRITEHLHEGLEGADVVMVLRVQRERLQSHENLSLETYHQQFAVKRDSLALTRPDVMIMHPGPVNRGIEIDSEVVDGPHSVILQQVRNGIWMRMAILEALQVGV